MAHTAALALCNIALVVGEGVAARPLGRGLDARVLRLHQTQARFTHMRSGHPGRGPLGLAAFLCKHCQLSPYA